MKARSNLAAEKRKKHRQTVHVRAWINAGSGEPRSCIICNIAELGAYLTMAQEEDVVSVPRAFELWLTSNGKARRFCEVVWRDKFGMGVKFVSSRTLKPVEEAPLDC